jgi:hypothetical protein
MEASQMRAIVVLFIAVLALALTAPGPARSEILSSVSSWEKVAAQGGEAGGAGEAAEPAGTEEAKEEEAPSTFGPIVTDTAVPIDKGHFAIQPTFGYGFVTDEFGRKWKRESEGGDFQSFSMDWKFTYGPIENMEVFVDIPYAHNWARNVDEEGPDGESSANSGNLGDVNLTVKYRLVEETASTPTITALFSTDFPTGKYKHLDAGKLGTDATGGGSYVFTPGINLSKYIKPFIVYANLWYSMPTSYTDDDGTQHPGDFVTINLAAEYPLTDKWVGLMELTSSWGGGRLFGPDDDAPQADLVSIVPGIEYMATDKFSMALGVSVDVIGKNSDATVAPLLSMAYAF